APSPASGRGGEASARSQGCDGDGYGLNDFHDRFAMVDLEAFATGYLKLA
ncbi:MAG: hypothetical protein RL240_3820, partial [Planctomycetota bacterium]